MSQVFSSASQKASARKPSRPGRLRVAIAGPELIAVGLNSLLSSQAEMETLAPLPDLQQVVDFIVTMRNLHTPVDVVVLDWNGNYAYQDLRLRILSQLSRYQQACLVLMATVFPEEVEHIKQAGARGYIFATSSFSQFAGAIRLLAGNKEATYFPALPEHAFASNNDRISPRDTQRVDRKDATGKRRKQRPLMGKKCVVFPEGGLSPYIIQSLH